MYYVSFAIIQSIGFVFVLLTAYDKQVQLLIITLTTFFYIIWALAHQYIHHHLNAKIMVEYILIGTLGVAVSLLLFNV